MRKPYLKIAESVNTFFQNTVLSIIFVFNSNISHIRSMFAKTLAPILFPLVIIPDAIASLFAIFRFASAKNKNLGLTFDLIHAPIKTALVFTAVFAGLSLIFVQSLFLTAVGSSVIYHIGLSLYHAYHWRKAAKDSSMSALHKSNTLSNLLATTIGSTVIAGIVLTMVIAPYLGATVLAVAGIGTATMLILSTIFAIYRNFKNPPTTQTVENSETANLSSSKTSTIDNETVVSSSNLVTSGYHTQPYYEKFTSDKRLDKELLLEIISAKKQSLEVQIQSSIGSFGECIWPENPKREDKIKLLKTIEEQISGSSKGDTLPKPSNKAFQSFFKEKGEVENIANAAHVYLQQYSN